MMLLRNRGLRIALDVVLLIGFVAEFITREGPDYALHSWIGIALTPIIGVHLASNWKWITNTVRRRRQHPEWPLARFNGVFAVTTGVCIITGFPLWLDWSDGAVWTVTHTVTGFVSILLAGSHLWRNRSRIRTLLRRRPSSPKPVNN